MNDQMYAKYDGGISQAQTKPNWQTGAEYPRLKEKTIDGITYWHEDRTYGRVHCWMIAGAETK